MSVRSDTQAGPASTKRVISLSVTLAAAIAMLAMFADRTHAQKVRPLANADPISANAQQMIDQGRQIFRFDTFGDEAFWGDNLRLHQAIQGSKFGGAGPGVSPRTALAVGLKVDADALPNKLIKQLKRGEAPGARKERSGRISEVALEPPDLSGVWKENYVHD
jgi:hypothetical protein